MSKNIWKYCAQTRKIQLGSWQKAVVIKINGKRKCKRRQKGFKICLTRIRLPSVPSFSELSGESLNCFHYPCKPCQRTKQTGVRGNSPVSPHPSFAFLCQLKPQCKWAVLNACANVCVCSQCVCVYTELNNRHIQQTAQIMFNLK